MTENDQPPRGKAHSGFVNGVNALLPEINPRISQYVQSNEHRHIIFTGHSAGGAVASLAYMHMLSSLAGKDGIYPDLCACMKQRLSD